MTGYRGQQACQIQMCIVVQLQGQGEELLECRRARLGSDERPGLGVLVVRLVIGTDGADGAVRQSLSQGLAVGGIA